MNSEYKNILTNALSHSVDYLEASKKMPVAASKSLVDLRNSIDRGLTSDGVDAMAVLDDLVTDTKNGLICSTSGRFFGWVIGGSLPVALAADWLTSTWDQNSTLYATSPAQSVIEEVCGQWLKDLLGLPETASFAIVTGCQMAHATCLAAARNSLLSKRGWNVESSGLFEAPKIRVLSGHRHGSIERALRLLGFGTACIEDVPLEPNGQMSADGLRQTLAKDRDRPAIVLLQAGDINTGGFDSFSELVPIAREHNAWVHVDGAFGLWANAHPGFRKHLKDVELADSWATDGHKWLNVPFDCGYAFIADPTAHRAAMSQNASYITLNKEARDQMEWTPEWSRRGRATASYAAIRHLGRNGISELVKRTCDHAADLVNRLGNLPCVEIVSPAMINQGLVRFLDPRPNAVEDDHDRRTDLTISDLIVTGEAFFQATTWNGKRCMRISVCNWQTDKSDVDRAVAATKNVMRHWMPFYE